MHLQWEFGDGGMAGMGDWICALPWTLHVSWFVHSHNMVTPGHPDCLYDN